MGPVLQSEEAGRVAGTRALIERYNQVAAKMAAEYSDDLLEEMGWLQEQLDHREAWDLDSRVEQAMDALRCPPPDAGVSMLSGGERRRVALRRLLLSQPDLLLLDEPTNHLDAESVGWLEQHLAKYPGTVLAVTHDRYFLDNVADWILELDRGHAYPYAGNYSTYLEIKAARMKVEGQRDAKLRRRLDAAMRASLPIPKNRILPAGSVLSCISAAPATARCSAGTVGTGAFSRRAPPPLLTLPRMRPLLPATGLRATPKPTMMRPLFSTLAAAKSLLFTSSAGIEAVAGGDDLEMLCGMGRRAPCSGTGLAIGSLTLAGLPPTAGFVSEWFLLESLMQQFRVPGLGYRLVLALAGAAVALTVGFAGVTFVRLVGLVVLGPGRRRGRLATPAAATTAGPGGRPSPCSPRARWRSPQ